MNVRIWEQADEGRAGPIYSFLLCAPYRLRSRFSEWKWIKGPEGGCYVTNSPSLALATAAQLRVEIQSNGTHALHGYPLSRTAAASKGLDDLKKE